MKLYVIISLLARLSPLFKSLPIAFPHRGLSFERANRWEVSHKCLIETLFEFMNKRTPMCPGWQNAFNGGASLQMQGMSRGSPTGLVT